MFGLMRGAARAMSREERQLWMGHICGVCIALRDSAGQASRITTNYDAALLSVLVTAQSAETTQTVTTYCPLRRQRRMAITAPDSDASQYGAALALLMAGTKIADHVDDKDGHWYRMRMLSKPLSNRWLTQGEKLAGQVEFDPQPIRKQVMQQAEVEAVEAESFHFYAEPTMQAASAVFAHTALLAEKPQNERPLLEIGRNFGLITYLLDAYQDIASDIKHNHFNPLVQLFAPHERKEQAQAEFKKAHLALRRAVYQLELAQSTLLRKLLLQSLKTIGERTLGLARSCSNGRCRLPAIASAAEFDDENVQELKDKEQSETTGAAQRDSWSCCDCCFFCDCFYCDCDGVCGCFECCGECDNAGDCCCDSAGICDICDCACCCDC